MGAGVHGPVFRGEDPESGRTIAIKAFPLDITPEQAATLAAGFEHLAAVNLAHPSIVQPLGAGAEGSTVFLVQDYVIAESIDVAIRQYGPAPVPDALRLVGQLAGALDFAAVAGVHHGALHPRDILVAPNDVRMTGLGVAQALEQVGVRVAPRRPYSAPERREPGAWAGAADVFSLASVAFELLTGRRPAGASEALAAEVASVPSSDPALLGEVFGRALSRRPEDRFPTALAFAAALRHALTGEPLDRPDVGALDPAAPRRARAGGPRRSVPTPEEPEIIPAGLAPEPVSQQVDAVPETGSQQLDASSETAPAGRVAADERQADERQAEVAAIPLPEPPEPAAVPAEDAPVEAAILPVEEEPVEAAILPIEDEPFEAPTLALEPTSPADASLDDFRRNEPVEEPAIAGPTQLGEASHPESFDSRLPLDRESVLPPELLPFAPSPVAEVPASPPLPEPDWARVEAEPATTPERRRARLDDDRAERPSRRRADLPIALTEAQTPDPGRPQMVVPPAPIRRTTARSRFPLSSVVAMLLVGLLIGFTVGYLIGSGEGPAQPPGQAETTLAPADQGASPSTSPTESSEAAAVPAETTPLPVDTPPPAAPVSSGADEAEKRSSASRGPAGRPADTRSTTPPARRQATTPDRRPQSVQRFEAPLTIVSRPAGALVRLDGRPVGKTPLRMSAVSAGSHAIRLELEGYRPWSAAIQVVVGRTNRVNASLDQRPGGI